MFDDLNVIFVGIFSTVHMEVDHISTSGKFKSKLKIEALNVKSKGESRVGKSRTAKPKSKLGGGGWLGGR